jgi:NAD(P)-dependent dehydrogenase (short-subunit alcohol dehydrogenase family)
MKDPKPTSTTIPTEDGGFQKYKAAGKLAGKKAIITGGDSGIGRAVAILFAMEGADSLIAYLPEEEEDAKETQKKVEEIGRKCHLLPVDIKTKANCRKVVDTALEKLGGINILVNNAGTQLQYESIKDLPECVNVPHHPASRHY